MSLEALTPGVLLVVMIAMLLAAFVHGALGFGFPLIATPIVALVLDIKMAIVLVAPVTLVATVLSVVRGGGWRDVLRAFWFLPLTMAFGSYLGTRLLIRSDPAPFLLVLAILILAYLTLDRVERTQIPWLTRHRVAIGLGVGLVAGFFEAAANVAVPPLIVYLMLLGLPPVATVQTLNLCFSVGKSVQVGTWVVHGAVPPALWLAAAAIAVPAMAVQIRAMRLRERIDADTYRRWLRGALWAMAALLVMQYVHLTWFNA